MIIIKKPTTALLLGTVAAGLFDRTSLISGVSALPVQSQQLDGAEWQQLQERYSSPRVGVVLKNGSAFPLDKRDALVKLPLKRTDLPEGTDPLLAFQHHVNKANEKLARMKGIGEVPSRRSLAEDAELRRRALLAQRSETHDPASARLLFERKDASEDEAQEGLVHLVNRSLIYPHGRLGIVVKDQPKKSNAAYAEPAGRQGYTNKNAKRLVGGLLDGLLSPPAAASSPIAGTSMPSAADSGLPSTGSPSVGSTVKFPAPVPIAQTAPWSAPSAGSASPVNSGGFTVPVGSATNPGLHAPSSSSSTSNGYSKADLAAAIGGGLTPASPPTAQGSLGLDIEANDVGYVATIQVGSQQRPFRMLIDSGSADTWVAHTNCNQCGSTHQRLGPSASSTFNEQQGSTFSITYGTGAVRGVLANDDVNIAGMVLRNHTLGLAYQETSDFSDPSVPFDGLMGLARTELSNSNTPTPIDALFKEGQVPAPVMGYHLGRVADGYNDGEVTFGGVDAEKFTGILVEIPNVSTQGFWEATVDRATFNGNDLGLTGRTAILDTGTSLIVAPQADAEAVHAAIPGAKADGKGGYTIPCTTSESFALTFGGQEFSIDPRDMTFLPVDQNNLQGDCVSAISAGTVGQANEWLVGAAFLKNVYFATNAKANVIGLAKLAPRAAASA